MTVHFMAFHVQDDQVRGVFDLKLARQRLLVVRHAQRDRAFMDELDDVVMGKRNRFHLLAAASTGVEEVEE